jgi:hypothetical protein
MKPSLPVLVLAALFFGSAAEAQQPAPAAPPATNALASQRNQAQPAGNEIERTARRFRIGLQGGVGLDPEIIDFGVHATLGPIFRPSLTFRPGLEIGTGEVTTLLNINLDVLYAFPGFTDETRWIPYVGAGPAFGLSHRGFETEEGDHVDVDGPGVNGNEDRNRFDFSDTDFNGGMNFIVGMRRQSGVFFEMKATAWGVSNIRLLAGFNF